MVFLTPGRFFPPPGSPRLVARISTTFDQQLSHHFSILKRNMADYCDEDYEEREEECEEEREEEEETTYTSDLY